MAIEVDIEVEGAEEAAEAVGKVGRRVSHVGQSLIAAVVNDFISILRAEMPFRTGRMRESITSEVRGNVGVVRVEVPYAAIVNRGAPSHVILPRRRRALVFQKPSGEIVYTKRIRHPGFEGRRFIENAIRKLHLRKMMRMREKVSELFYE